MKKGQIRPISQRVKASASMKKYLLLHPRLPLSSATKEKISAATREYFRKHPEAKLVSADTRAKQRVSRLAYIASHPESLRAHSLRLVGRFGAEKSATWQGGITPLNFQIRNSFEMRQWRCDVFTRDNFTCQKCGVRGGEIHAHHSSFLFSLLLKEYHITSMAQARECAALWDINNGLTLCYSCHRDVHKNEKKA